MSIDHCVCCGSYIPEGRQICQSCSDDNYKQMSKEEADMIRWLASTSNHDILKEMRRTDKELFGHEL